MVNILCWSLFRNRHVVSDGLVRSADSCKLKDVKSGIVLNSRTQNLIFAWSSNWDSLKRHTLETKKCVWTEKKRTWRPWRCHLGWQFLMAHIELTSACPVCPRIPTHKNEQIYCHSLITLIMGRFWQMIINNTNFVSNTVTTLTVFLICNFLCLIKELYFIIRLFSRRLESNLGPIECWNNRMT
jgi:hypothetical protein